MQPIKTSQHKQDSEEQVNDPYPPNSPQVNTKKSNISNNSEISFNGEQQKPKSKSFNRIEKVSQSNDHQLIRQLSYSNDMKRLLKKLSSYDRDRLYRLSVSEFNKWHELELSRIKSLKSRSRELRDILTEESSLETDNELSMVVIKNHIKALVEFNNLNGRSASNGGHSQKDQQFSRVYQRTLLEVERSEQKMQKFIEANLRLVDPSELNISECKRFFREELSQTKETSDRIVLARRTLCQIIYFFCRILEGETLAFNDVYERREENTLQEYEVDEDGNKVKVNEVKVVKNDEVIVRNLDNSGGDEEELGISSDLKRGKSGKLEFPNQSHHMHDWNDYSGKDVGLKVNELSGICEQIPQLETFVRTLKFSKITLDNRESFFKIVNVLIQLHNKVGYLGRNKPALLREMESISIEFEEIYEAIHRFVQDLISEAPPAFRNVNFPHSRDDYSTHQMTEMFSSLRKDLSNLSLVIETQDKANTELQERITLIKSIVEKYWKSISSGDFDKWDEYTRKVSGSGSNEEEAQIIHQLNESLNIMDAELQNGNRSNRGVNNDETSKNLQAEVNILLADYERLKSEHQQLQGQITIMSQEKEEMQFDIDERDKMISNLTNLKLKYEKRERSLANELHMAQNDRENFQHMIDGLEQELERISIENQTAHNELVYEHQDQIKELVDKKTELERAKMELLQKYEQQCMKSIQNLHGSDMTNMEVQNLKDRLDKKTKELDTASTKFRETVSSLQKQIMELKNTNHVLQNELELAGKNNKKLMDKLEEANARFNEKSKDNEERYEDEMSMMRENTFKLEKQLEMYKRNNSLLKEEIEQLNNQIKQTNKGLSEYRLKINDLGSIQNEYEILGKEYEALLLKNEKLDGYCQNYKRKIEELTGKLEEYAEALPRREHSIKKLQKLVGELQSKLEEVNGAGQKLEDDYKSLQKTNRSNEKKIQQLQMELQSLRESGDMRNKDYTTQIGKLKAKFQEEEEGLNGEIEALKEKLRQANKDKEKLETNYQQKDSELKKHLEEYEKKYKEFSREKKVLNQKVSEREARIRQLEEDGDNISKMLDEYKREKMDLELRLEQIKREYANSNRALQSEAIELKEEIERLNAEVEKLKQKLSRTVNELKECQNRHLQPEPHSQPDINASRQKNEMIQESRLLSQKNSNLEAENESLRRLNFDLESNVKKLCSEVEQSKKNQLDLEQELQAVKKTLKQNKAEISGLNDQKATLNLELQSLQKKYKDLSAKYGQMEEAVSEKENAIAEKIAENKSINKQLRELNQSREGLNGEIQSSKVQILKLRNRIKSLEEENQQQSTKLIEYKRKEESSRHTIAGMEANFEREKLDYETKLTNAKRDKQEAERYHQEATEAAKKQHEQEIKDWVKRAQKDAQNQFNQKLIKEKEKTNLLYIEKMEELTEMKLKYDKLLRDEKESKFVLEQEYSKLMREFSDYKKNQSLNRPVEPKALNGPSIDPEMQEELNRLRGENQTLKREVARISNQAGRLQKELNALVEENSKQITKNLQLEHSNATLTPKLQQMKINLESAKKDLENLSILQRENSQLERNLEKQKSRVLEEQGKNNDLRQVQASLTQKNLQLQLRIKQYRESEEELKSQNLSLSDRLKALTNELSELKREKQSLESQLAAKERKLKQKDKDYEEMELGLTDKLKQYQGHQKKLKELENECARVKGLYQEDEKKWDQKEAKYRLEIKSLSQRNKELEYEAEKGRRSTQQISEMTIRLSTLLSEHQSLKDQISKLNIYLNEVKQAKSKLENSLFEREKENQSLSAECRKLDRSLQSCRLEIQQLKKQKDSLQEEVQRTTMQVHRLEEELSLLKGHSSKSLQLEEQLKKMKAFYNEEMRSLETKLKAGFEDQRANIVAQFQEVLAGLNKEIENLNKSKRELEAEMMKLKRKNNELESIENTLRSENMAFSDDIQKLGEKIRSLERQKSQLEHQFNGDLQGKINSLNDESERNRQQKNRLENEIRKLQAELQNARQTPKEEQDRLQNQIRNLRAQLQQARQQILSLRHSSEVELTKLQAQIDHLKRLLEQQRSKSATLAQQNADLNRDMTVLANTVKELQTQNSNLKGQEGDELAKTKAALALTRQELVRVNDLKGNLERRVSELDSQNNLLKRENQNLLRQISELRNSLQSYESGSVNSGRELSRLREQIEQLQKDNSLLKGQLAQKTQQNSAFERDLLQRDEKIRSLGNEIASKQREIDQLSRALKNGEEQMKAISKDLQKQKDRLLQEQRERDELSRKQLSESQVKDQEASMELARLRSELAITRSEYDRLNSEHNKLKKTCLEKEEELIKSKFEVQSLKSENERLTNEIRSKELAIQKLNQEIDRLNAELKNKWSSATNLEGDRERLNQENQNLRRQIENMGAQIDRLVTILEERDASILQMSTKMEEIQRLADTADREIKVKHEEHQKLRLQIDGLNKLNQELQKEKQLRLKAQAQAKRLQEKLTALERELTQIRQSQHLSVKETQDLSQSRNSSSINLVSYSYKGGQVTNAELKGLEEEIRRLLKELQSRDKTIEKLKNENNSLSDEIKNLRQQIDLLSQGKTLNIKGYTRVTNPNDMTLNTKGIVYTEYDVREMKAKIQMLEETVNRYQNRQTELIRELQKFKFRERAYQEQIRKLQEDRRVPYQSERNPPSGEPQPQSPTKKTRFDYEGHKQGDAFPQSSTYRMQSGIEKIQTNINMKGESSVADKHFLTIEGEELARAIERITQKNAVMGSKIDEILSEQSKRSTQERDTLVYNLSQSSVSKELITEVRELIHQNKALIETLRNLKEYRQDINLLLHAYIDPNLVTEYVFRILKYFSEVEDSSKEATLIREELQTIRANNVGGYYFTVLEEYTKFILENNSIEIYKYELRQRAMELLDFKEKFQSLIDSKLEGSDKFLKKSDSRNSLISRSRSKYMSGSRVRYEYSEVGKEDRDDYANVTNSRNIINITPATLTVTPSPSEQRNRASSHISYVPYSQQNPSDSRTSFTGVNSLNPAAKQAHQSSSRVSHHVVSNTTVTNSVNPNTASSNLNPSSGFNDSHKDFYNSYSKLSSHQTAHQDPINERSQVSSSLQGNVAPPGTLSFAKK